MPRVTLYVPDDLKTRMDASGDDINWSSVAQRAFLGAIVSRNVMKEPNMTNVIERLRASKQRVESKASESGKACGATWAQKHAEFDELSRVAAFAGRDAGIADLQALIDDTGEMGPSEWHEYWEAHGDNGDPSDAFARGFIEGATKVFNEVSDQL